MNNVFEDVAEFHRMFGQPVRDTPRFPDAEEIAMRKRLLAEELMEMAQGLAEWDMVQVADAIADTIYILIGTAHTFGIPLAEVWAEVQRSNMTKANKAHDLHCPIYKGARCSCGSVLYREDGKILKGSRYEPAQIEAIMRKAGWVPVKEQPPAEPYERNK